MKWNSCSSKEVEIPGWLMMKFVCLSLGCLKFYSFVVRGQINSCCWFSESNGKTQIYILWWLIRWAPSRWHRSRRVVTQACKQRRSGGDCDWRWTEYPVVAFLVHDLNVSWGQLANCTTSPNVLLKLKSMHMLYSVNGHEACSRMSLKVCFWTTQMSVTIDRCQHNRARCFVPRKCQSNLTSSSSPMPQQQHQFTF